MKNIDEKYQSGLDPRNKWQLPKNDL